MVRHRLRPNRLRRRPAAVLLRASPPAPGGDLPAGLPLTGAWRDIATKHYVAAQWPGDSPMALSTQRAHTDPGITVHHWDVRHNVLADGPARVLQLLRSLPNYTDTTTQQLDQST